MNVQQMQQRWDAINEELERTHDQMTADGRPTEEAIAAAQAPLIEERKQLEREFTAMRRAEIEVEKLREVGVAFIA